MISCHQIETKIRVGLELVYYIDITDESHHHSVPVGTASHFKVIVVSNYFEGKDAIMRHRAIFALLANELTGPIYALTLRIYTVSEWQERQGIVLNSPPCYRCHLIAHIS